ncbi:hypothetical protein, partial [Neisseria cinerea]|uniref:hypothetical protein n=1 Tax=Neisseria cinerea TaxID=483 RepID=UPI003C7D0004
MKTAQETLIQFIQKMKDYELYWGGLTQKSLDEGTFFEINQDEDSKKRSDEIKKIHQEFLSKKALSLRQARQEAPSFGMPPEYNQTITAERKISDKKYEIDVLSERGEKKTYTLVLEGG